MNRNTSAVEALVYRASHSQTREPPGAANLALGTVAPREEDVTRKPAEADGEAHHPSPDGVGFVTAYPAGGQRFHGPTSLLSFVVDFDGIVDRAFTSNMSLKVTLSSQACIQDTTSRLRMMTLWDQFRLHKSQIYHQVLEVFAQSQSPDLSHDGSPLVMPSRDMLERVTQGYFKHINPVTPVIGQAHLAEAIGRCYAGDHNTTPLTVDPAWVVMFNYVVIRCLAGQYMPLERRVEKMDFAFATQLERPFVANIRRALGCLDHFMSPKLINVQALTSLVSTVTTLSQPLTE